LLLMRQVCRVLGHRPVTCLMVGWAIVYCGRCRELLDCQDGSGHRVRGVRWED